MTRYQSLIIPELATGTPLEKAVELALETDQFGIDGVAGGSLAPFLVKLCQRRQHPVIVITPDRSEARYLIQDLAFHLREQGVNTPLRKVLTYPPYDLGPYDELAPDRRTVMQRTGTLFQLIKSTDWRFLVVPADSILRKIVPSAEFESACMRISKGEQLARDRLLERLEKCGYHRAPLVEEPGTYAVRGSIVDLFPSYLAFPARIDLFGSDVENIRFFDPTTQSSEAEVDDIWIHPMRLALHPSDADERQAAAERLRLLCDDVNQPTSQTEKTIEDVLSGRLLVGAEGFYPAFHTSLGCLVDYLPSSMTVCLTNQEGIRMAWAKHESTLQGDYERRQDEGSPCFPPESHAVKGDAVESFLELCPRVVVQGLPIVDSADDTVSGKNPDTCNLNAASTANMGDRFRHLVPEGSNIDLVGTLANHLKDLEEQSYRTTLVAHTEGQGQRLLSMLKGRGLKVQSPSSDKGYHGPGHTVAVGELQRGCLLPGDGCCWITEEEVFGRRTRRRRTTRGGGVSLDDLRQLKPRDLVVHEEHGIGRYDGLVRQRVRNAEMDFLLIVYRGGDKLYLPVYRLNQVQKYKGGEGKERLDKLGGQTFAKAKAEVRRAASDMASKLLDLYARRATATRPPLDSTDDLYQAFEASFPFEETEDQARAIDEVMADLELGHPMDRLVCGDVGFGKTEVAMRAAFRVVMGGRQMAVLVPTTVLAQQHFQTFKARFSPYPIRVEMLSRFRKPAQNSDVVFGLKEGTVDIVVGTHRLLSKDVHFQRLGLLVVDEEHRFGVAHKERIRSLRASVDTLVLTATPIPRTLQMAFGGVRDLSLIGTAPQARRSIRTMICHDKPVVLREAIERELAREGQVFFVHNRVKDIKKIASNVQRMVPDARIVIGHGQMKEAELEQVMLDFVAGRYDILVCTSIIESGLDIPRANTIIINRADMFGLAQLYQLRGRVGRSHQQAYAYLVVPPLSVLGEEARQRVETLARYTDLGSGFSVATMDMELRGAGNLLGREQSGSVSAVGYEMFCDLLLEATNELRGEEKKIDVEPELTFEQPGLISEEYLPDVGQRLQYYKRLASADSEEEVESIAAELVDRYGVLPEETEDLIKIMVVKALSRRFGIRGVESTLKRMTVHLAPDSRVEPDVLIEIMHKASGRVQLTGDLKVKVRFSADEPGGADSAIHFLHQLGAYGNKPSIS